VETDASLRPSREVANALLKNAKRELATTMRDLAEAREALITLESPRRQRWLQRGSKGDALQAAQAALAEAEAARFTALEARRTAEAEARALSEQLRKLERRYEELRSAYETIGRTNELKTARMESALGKTAASETELRRLRDAIRNFVRTSGGTRNVDAGMKARIDRLRQFL